MPRGGVDNLPSIREGHEAVRRRQGGPVPHRRSQEPYGLVPAFTPLPPLFPFEGGRRRRGVVGPLRVGERWLCATARAAL